VLLGSPIPFLGPPLRAGAPGVPVSARLRLRHASEHAAVETVGPEVPVVMFVLPAIPSLQVRGVDAAPPMTAMTDHVMPVEHLAAQDRVDEPIRQDLAAPEPDLARLQGRRQQAPVGGRTGLGEQFTDFALNYRKRREIHQKRHFPTH